MKAVLSTLLLSLAGVTCATPLTNTVMKGVHKVGFDIKRGSTYADSSFNAKPRFVKRDDTAEAELTNEDSFYLIDLDIGSNNQTVGILIDTGSSDLWVMGSNNPYCMSSSSSSSKSVSDKLIARRNKGVKLPGHGKAITGGGGGPPDVATSTGDSDIATEIATANDVQATIDCSEYGTFDESASSSFTSNNTEFLIQYADYTFAYGDWGYDDVTIGSATVNDLSFAVANESNSTIGVLGIGLTGLETTYAGSLTNTNYEYENLPVKMVSQGLINKAAYSLYLDSSDSSSGTILFGGVDHSKYSGTLGLIPIINTLSASGYSSPIKLEITLSSITIPTGDGDESVLITSTLAPALLDSGTTLSYVPEYEMIKIGEALGATYSSSVGAYIMECVDSSNTTTVDFNFSGVVISVPLTDLLVEVSTSTGGSTSYCAVGTLSSGDDSYILGDSFLRSAYVVYDLEDLQIAMAQSNTDSSSEDIEAISDSIPSATTAASYSSTWSTSQYDTTTALVYTTVSASNSTTSTDSDSDTDSDSSSSSSSDSGSSSSSSSSSTDSQKSTASQVSSSPALILAILVVSVTLFAL